MTVATTNATFNGLRDSESRLGELRDQVETLMHDKVTPKLSAMADSAQQAATQARDSVRDSAANVSHRVQDRPLTAIALAGGIGFLLGMLFRR